MAKGWLVGGAVFLGAILVASIVVALLESNEPLPTGTPEATVQLFLEAVEDDNIELAYTVLSTDLMVECAVDEFFGTAGWPGDRLRGDRITLEDGHDRERHHVRDREDDQFTWDRPVRHLRVVF